MSREISWIQLYKAELEKFSFLLIRKSRYSVLRDGEISTWKVQYSSPDTSEIFAQIFFTPEKLKSEVYHHVWPFIIFGKYKIVLIDKGRRASLNAKYPGERFFWNWYESPYGRED